MNNKKACEHFAGIDENIITPKTSGWVALRVCIICGHEEIIL